MQFPVGISAYDEWENPKTDGEGDGTVTLSGLDEAPDGTDPVYGNPVDLEDGTGTTNVTAYDATTDPLPDDPTKITATAGSVSGDSDLFTVLPAAAVELVVNDIPNHEFGTPIDVTVRTRDEFENFGAEFVEDTSIELTMYVYIETPLFTGPTRVTLTEPATNSPENPAVVFEDIVYPVIENSVVAEVRAIAGGGSRIAGEPTAGDVTPPFDVLEELVQGTSSLKKVYTCLDATPETDTCVIWKLPRGLNSPLFYVTQGACVINPTDTCVGSMAGLFPDLFSGTEDPAEENDLFADYTARKYATLIIELDRTLRPSHNRAAHGWRVDWEIQAADGPFKPVRKCKKRNYVFPGESCVNNVTIDRRGDLVTEIILYGDDLLARGR